MLEFASFRVHVCAAHRCASTAREQPYFYLNTAASTCNFPESTLFNIIAMGTTVIGGAWP